MKNTLLFLTFVLLSATAMGADRVPAHPHILVETTEGSFKLELDGRAAPLTVANFLKHVDAGFYDGLIFHRVIPGFMIQGGGYTPGFKNKEGEETIPNESGNGLPNVRGTIAMARLQEPHTASSQFFINVVDNHDRNMSGARLDPIKDPGKGRWGYAVFGYVIEGMDIVDKIASVQTAPNGPGGAPAPVVPVVIKKMSRVEY